MSCLDVSNCQAQPMVSLRDLLERLIVDKACRIFRDVQLAFLELFTKLPTVRPITSGFDVRMMVADNRKTLDQRHDRAKDKGHGTGGYRTYIFESSVGGRKAPLSPHGTLQGSEISRGSLGGTSGGRTGLGAGGHSDGLGDDRGGGEGQRQ